MLSNDCKKCRKEVNRGIECRKCSDRYCFKCVGFNFSVAPKYLSTSGLCWFCDSCKIDVLNYVRPVGATSVDEIGVVLVDTSSASSSQNLSSTIAREQVHTSLGSDFSGFQVNGSDSQVEHNVSSVCNLSSVSSVVSTIPSLSSVSTATSLTSVSTVSTITSVPTVQDLGSEEPESSVSTVSNVEINPIGTDDENGWTMVNGNRVRRNRNVAVSSTDRTSNVRRNPIGNSNRPNRYGEIYVAGDSIVRYQKDNLRKKLGTKKVDGFCLPGGKIDHIGNCVADLGNYKNVVVSVGTNEINKTGSVEIENKYRSLLDSLKSKRCNVVVVGILPRIKLGSDWSSRAVSTNNFLQQECLRYNFQYLDMWDIMYRNRQFYNRDGVHLNYMGRQFFSDRILGKLSERENFFRSRM